MVVEHPPPHVYPHSLLLAQVLRAVVMVVMVLQLREKKMHLLAVKIAVKMVSLKQEYPLQQLHGRAQLCGSAGKSLLLLPVPPRLGAAEEAHHCS